MTEIHHNCFYQFSASISKSFRLAKPRTVGKKAKAGIAHNKADLHSSQGPDIVRLDQWFLAFHPLNGQHYHSEPPKQLVQMLGCKNALQARWLYLYRYIYTHTPMIHRSQAYIKWDPSAWWPSANSLRHPPPHWPCAAFLKVWRIWCRIWDFIFWGRGWAVSNNYLLAINHCERGEGVA